MLISLVNLLSQYPDHELIIGGDFNGVDEGDSSEEGSIAWFTAESGVIYIHDAYHTGPFPSTYDRGTKRIDQIYVSDRLSSDNFFNSSTIGGYNSVFPSDHRPILLDFDARRFFDARSFTSQPSRTRIIRFNDPRLTRKYFEHALCGISSQKLDVKLNRLAHRVRDIGEVTRKDEK